MDNNASCIVAENGLIWVNIYDRDVMQIWRKCHSLGIINFSCHKCFVKWRWSYENYLICFYSYETKEAEVCKFCCCQQLPF